MYRTLQLIATPITPQRTAVQIAFPIDTHATHSTENTTTSYLNIIYAFYYNAKEARNKRPNTIAMQRPLFRITKTYYDSYAPSYIKRPPMIAMQNALRQTGLLVAIMGGLAYYFISQMSIFTTIYNNIKYNYIIVQ